MASRPQALPTQPTGLPVGSYATYAEAQRAVDYLSDNEFPVENVTIVGSDLQMVERVTGRLTRGRAVLGGAASGAWFGSFVGVLLGLFSNSGTSFVVLLLSGIAYGALFGAAFGFLGYAATGGRRDFTSNSQIVAGSYAVLCQSQHAEKARDLLARLSLKG
jgi:hypothetical protein